MDDQQAGCAAGFEHPPRWFHGSAQERDIVTECFAESPRVDEVALHVDHDQRGGSRIELEVVGLCGHHRHELSPSIW
jgi:hypothetical protein